MSDGATGLEHATVTLRSGVTVLADFTLLAEPGEIMAVLGPSGSGKSTFLRAVGGLDKVSEGRVLIGGEPVGDNEPRQVAMVFQDVHLVPFLDAARNMAFPLEINRTPAPERESRVAEQAARFGLNRVLRRKPQSLSVGETARVGLGRAMIRSPRAFLLDEPLAHLDARERVNMRRRLREVISETGVTTFHVTHDAVEAFAVGDRLAVVDAGRVLQVGRPADIYAAPDDVTVANLASPLGISLLTATVLSADGLGGYRVGDRTLPTYAPLPAVLQPLVGTGVVLGLRPEDAHEKTGPDDAELTGTVRLVESLGPSSLVRLEVAGGELTARFPPHTSLRPGQPVTVGIDAARAHVFEAGSGRALAHPPA